MVLVLGSIGHELLNAQKVIAKGRTITSLRGKAWTHPATGQQFLFSYSSGISEIDYGKYVDLLCDVKLALRLASTGSTFPQIGTYQYVEDFSMAVAAIEASETPVECSLDLETVGLDPYAVGVYPVSIQFSYAEGMAHVVTFDSKQDYDFRMGGLLGMQLNFLLNSKKIRMRGANLKYDLHWLWVHGGFECANFTMDTTAVGSCLDENRSNSLNVHAKVMTSMGGYDDPFNDKADKSRMDLELIKDPEGFLTYAGGDTDACLRVSGVQKKELMANQPLARFYTTILHPALRAFEQVEQGGVLVDMDAYTELEKKLNVAMGESVATIKELAGGRIYAKHRDEKKTHGLNPTKASFLCDYMFSPMGLNLKPRMFTPKGDAPSTAMQHLEQFEDHPDAGPFVKALAGYAEAAKMLSTYVIGFQKHIRTDGRFHPTYWLFAGDKDDSSEGGTVTGRLSCKDPAFQTIPKHTIWAKALRKCFIAPPGYGILENDYSQGELRVMACIADEPTMLHAYANDMDLHAVTAGPFRGYSYEDMLVLKKTNKDLYDEIRQYGKAGNFGLIYGMSAEGFMNYARIAYGVHLTMKQATDFRDAFFARYEKLVTYHMRYKAFAGQNGYVASPLGRIRHLPLINSSDRFSKAKAQRQSINSPVQSTLSDMMIWAIALAHKQGWFKQAPCFGMVHDAKYTYIPLDNWEMYAKRERENMENLPFHEVGWEPQLVFKADGKFGPTMADLKEVKV